MAKAKDVGTVVVAATGEEITMTKAIAVAAPAAIKVKITLEVEVTPAFLKDVNGSIAYVRESLNEMVEGLDGQLLSVDIA